MEEVRTDRGSVFFFSGSNCLALLTELPSHMRPHSVTVLEIEF